MSFIPSTKIGHRTKDESGKRYGMIAVVSYAGVFTTLDGEVRGAGWNCRCDCGVEKIIEGSALRRGHTKSCGCFDPRMDPRFKRGIGHTKEHKVWHSMISRCHNPSNIGFKHYGGMGIYVCDRWRESFYNFITDMGCPPKGMTIERKDNDGPYCLENCKWETRLNQAKNKRNCVSIEIGGEIKIESEWERFFGVKCGFMRRRRYAGKSVEKILEDIKCLHQSLGTN